LLAGLPGGGVFQGTVSDASGRSLAGQSAYMAQADLLVPWLRVRANIQLGARLRREPVDEARTDELLRRVGLTAHIDKHPAALSGGMRQRVALARTLLEDRPIVLLDEPFGALDARTRAEMQELAHELLTGRTVLLVTHEPAEAARLADTIHLLTRDGLAPVAVPPEPAIRAVDSPAVFAHAGAMLARLRGRQ
jgi:putative hydroxymethylpyrimidine transport system ATP-binding protein